MLLALWWERGMRGMCRDMRVVIWSIVRRGGGEMGVDLREVPRVFPFGDGKMVLGGKCRSGLVRRMLRLFQRGTSTGIANVSSQTVHTQKYSSMTVLLHF